jgi:hypothetical protein
MNFWMQGWWFYLYEAVINSCGEQITNFGQPLRGWNTHPAIVGY